jgi:hypothetical protein
LEGVGCTPFVIGWSSVEVAIVVIP